MTRIAIALIVGGLLGALTSVAVLQLQHDGGESSETIVRDIANIAEMDDAVAEQHRAESYASLTRIEEVAALPTPFARAAAMHALASRLESAGVQSLIHETNRILDDNEREHLLEVLFFRLAELDPQSALVLARTDRFTGTRALERIVWRAWARKDLDDALFAAKTQTSLADQKFAAQSLYAAFGGLENDTTDRIETELGIKPDRRTRGRYLYRLADRSMDEAIAFINAHENAFERADYVSWLAYHVSLSDPAEGLAHSDKFTVKADGERFRSILNANIARENPHQAIEEYFASGRSLRASSDIYSALHELAKTDLEAVKQYFAQVKSRDDRMMLGSTIASSLAQRDPVAALAWAREQDDELSNILISSALAQIAQSDPEQAFAIAMENTGDRSWSDTLQIVVHQVANHHPAKAADFVAQIQDDARRTDAAQQLVSSWMRQDADAAVEWVLSLGEDTSSRLLRTTASQLVNTDVDAAIRLLPQLSGGTQVSVRQQIARQLAASRSPQEAQAFIQQYEGQPGYDQLQSSLITGLAQTDLTAARQLAEQLAPGNARDSAYMQVISAQSRVDPSLASAWLQDISDGTRRAGAAGQIAAEWYKRDAQAATQWVTTMPRGSVRDSAIMQMSHQWRDPTPEHERLIASIDSRDKRGQAKVRLAYNLMRSDPEKAREILEDEDIPAAMREQAEAMLARYGVSY